MSAPGVVSKKLKFKGDKPKKKKRHHRETEDDAEGEFAAMAAADPRGWVFPSDVLEINGPTYIILPSEPLTCLAWDNQKQKVVAARVDVPEAPEGMDDLSASEVLAAVEPSDISHVWVASRLSGSEDVLSFRTTSGTFLTATPSGVLTANTPSRGPLESFKPILNPSSSSSSSSSPFPSFALSTQSEKYLSVSGQPGLGGKVELRADADSIGSNETLRVKCQREFVLKAKLQKDGEGKVKSRLVEGGSTSGSREDEMQRNREAQTWGAGRVVVSDRDRRDLKKARKEGRLAEAMLDRRAALKSDRYAK